MCCENKKWLDNESGVCKKTGQPLNRNDCVVYVGKKCDQYKEGWA